MAYHFPTPTRANQSSDSELTDSYRNHRFASRKGRRARADIDLQRIEQRLRGAPGSRRNRRFRNNHFSDYEFSDNDLFSDLDGEVDSDQEERCQWQGAFTRVGPSFFHSSAPAATAAAAKAARVQKGNSRDLSALLASFRRRRKKMMKHRQLDPGAGQTAAAATAAAATAAGGGGGAGAGAGDGSNQQLVPAASASAAASAFDRLFSCSAPPMEMEVETGVGYFSDVAIMLRREEEIQESLARKQASRASAQQPGGADAQRRRREEDRQLAQDCKTAEEKEKEKRERRSDLAASLFMLIDKRARALLRRGGRDTHFLREVERVLMAFKTSTALPSNASLQTVRIVQDIKDPVRYRNNSSNSNNSNNSRTKHSKRKQQQQQQSDKVDFEKTAVRIDSFTDSNSSSSSSSSQSGYLFLALPDSFFRLLTHALCTFHQLHSQSEFTASGERVIRVKLKKKLAAEEEKLFQGGMCEGRDVVEGIHFAHSLSLCDYLATAYPGRFCEQ